MGDSNTCSGPASASNLQGSCPTAAPVQMLPQVRNGGLAHSSELSREQNSGRRCFVVFASPCYMTLVLSAHALHLSRLACVFAVQVAQKQWRPNGGGAQRARAASCEAFWAGTVAESLWRFPVRRGTKLASVVAHFSSRRSVMEEFTVVRADCLCFEINKYEISARLKMEVAKARERRGEALLDAGNLWESCRTNESFLGGRL